MGAKSGAAEETWLRPETCQGLFTNYLNVVTSVRRGASRLPFGIAQTGRAFRNEISPRDFLFRQREFEQFELEWFCDPADARTWHSSLVKDARAWVEAQGVPSQSLKEVVLEKDDLAHYAVMGTDIYFDFPGFGWGEVLGVAHRGSHDMDSHEKASGKRLLPAGEEVRPHVIEPSFGADRILMAVLVSCLNVTEKRSVLSLPTHLSPFKACVMALAPKDPGHAARAQRVLSSLQRAGFSTETRTAGTVGARYRQSDEIGTSFCITADDQEDTVTVRDRDSTEQVRVAIADVVSHIRARTTEKDE
jgi:glycyl-tRNA synthetase